MDNASFHKGGNIEKIIENAGCHLLYLPAYSPDFNPIEHHWTRVKKIIRKYFIKPTIDLADWACPAFEEIMAK